MIPISNVLARLQAATVAIALSERTATQAQYEVLGSGFVVDRTGIVLTAAHVIEQAVECAQRERKKIEVYGLAGIAVGYDSSGSATVVKAFADLWFASVTHVTVSDSADIAAIRIRPEKAPPRGELELSVETLTFGNPVIAAGWPQLDAEKEEQRGWLYSTAIGTIIHAPQPPGHMHAVMATKSGFSGGPVVDAATGSVIGVHMATQPCASIPVAVIEPIEQAVEPLAAMRAKRGRAIADQMRLSATGTGWRARYAERYISRQR